MKVFCMVVVSLVVCYTYGQYIPQTPLPGSNQSGKNNAKPSGSGGGGTCQYTFQVPDPKGACTGTSSDLDKKLDLVKQDLDKTRFQYVSQNSLIQSTLAKIQSDTSGYISKVSDLSNELQKIKQSVSSPAVPQNTANPNNQNLNQIIHDTKDLLTKAIQDINNKIFNVTFEMQRSAVEESKVQSAIEKQINQQSAQIASAEQKLISLENMLKNMQTSSPAATNVAPTSAGPTVSSVLINQLKQQISKLESDVKNSDKTQAQEFKSLSDKTNQIMTELNNQSHEIDNIVVGTKAAFQRIASTEKELQDAKDNLTQVEKRYDPQLTIILQEISSVNKNMSRVESELKQLGTTLLNNKITAVRQRGDIAKLKTEATQLSSDVKNLDKSLSNQAGEILQLTATVQALPGGTLNSSSGGNTSAVSQLFNQVKTQIQSEVNATKSDLTSLQKIVMTLMRQVSSLATSCG